MQQLHPNPTARAALIASLLALLAAAPAGASDATAIGAGASAAARLDFRIVIPGRMQVRVTPDAAGGATLDARTYSRAVTLAVSEARSGREQRTADVGLGDVVKRARLDTAGAGVYTIASP